MYIEASVAQVVPYCSVLYSILDNTFSQHGQRKLQMLKTFFHL